MKRCFKCLRDLPVEEFYRHRMMADGRLSKCRDCTRADVRQHRAEHPERVREYDRQRSKLPHRIELARRIGNAWRKGDPARNKAHNAVAWALKSGQVQRQDSCEACNKTGVRLEKHHPDYSQPLVIMWLCKPCHALADKIRRRTEKAEAS